MLGMFFIYFLRYTDGHVKIQIMIVKFIRQIRISMRVYGIASGETFCLGIEVHWNSFHTFISFSLISPSLSHTIKIILFNASNFCLFVVVFCLFVCYSCFLCLVVVVFFVCLFLISFFLISFFFFFFFFLGGGGIREVKVAVTFCPLSEHSQ